MTELSKRLQEIQERITTLEDEARLLMEQTHPVRITKEIHDELTSWRYRDRYFIIRPDGELYGDVPGVAYRQASFAQRPAALRAAKWLPGARVYDSTDRVVITQ